jgi:ribokinase
MTEIVVLGSLNMDLSINVPRIPSPGETISGGNLVTSAGGKGANQAAACARMGKQVAMVGCVGQDDFGRRLKDGLFDMGVDVSHIKEETSTATGTAMILVDGKGENCIVLSSGTNRLVSIDAKITDLIKRAKILILQLEIVPEVVYQAIDIAAAAGVPVLLNPAPAIVLKPEIYAKIDYLIPNETEATLLTGEQVKDLWTAEKAADTLLQRGVKNVIITLGAEGALLATSESKTHIPTFKIEVVDTTGAGDAFIGGFASMLVEGKTVESALKFASAAGALAATKAGAQPSLPSRQELEIFLKNKTNSREVSI